MILETFACQPLATNSLLVACEVTKKAALFDPSGDSLSKFKELLKKNHLTPEAIYLTHSHWDHIIDASLCQETFGLPLFVHEADVKNLELPGSDNLPLMFPVTPAKATGFLKENHNYQIGTISFQVIHTPGHSPGSLCFFFPKEKILISGDTLFKGSIGNISFPTSCPNDMWNSLKKLESLPGNTTVYPGHGPKTRLDQETWISRAEEIFG